MPACNVFNTRGYTKDLFRQLKFFLATVSEGTKLKKKKKKAFWNPTHLTLEETGKDINFKLLLPKEACLVTQYQRLLIILDVFFTFSISSHVTISISTKICHMFLH